MELSEIRKALGKTPDEMRKRIGVSLSSYYSIEKDSKKIQPSIRLLLDMIEEYEIGPKSLHLEGMQQFIKSVVEEMNTDYIDQLIKKETDYIYKAMKIYLDEKLEGESEKDPGQSAMTG
ncbi:MAG: helix-turn-helix transcriptional regulator [Maribacter sp.]|nr:helix-turn-helix transcriptional regulator [Maribacter sp.]